MEHFLELYFLEQNHFFEENQYKVDQGTMKNHKKSIYRPRNHPKAGTRERTPEKVELKDYEDMEKGRKTRIKWNQETMKNLKKSTYRPGNHLKAGTRERKPEKVELIDYEDMEKGNEPPKAQI
jgi:hypothetical protein